MEDAPEHYKMYSIFRSAYEQATDGGLAAEFFEEFLAEIRAGSGVAEACWHALYEWDL